MKRQLLLLALCITLACSPSWAQADNETATGQKPTIRQLINKLSKDKEAEAAVEQLVARGKESKAQLKGEAIEGSELSRRGWAIIALTEIGGDDVNLLLKKIHDDKNQPMLVRTWAAAGRVSMTDDADALTKLAPLAGTFPAVGRPIGMRLVEKLSDGEEASAEGLLSVSLKVPQLQQALAPAILALGPEKLTDALTTAKDQNVRRQAAAYLGTQAGQGNKKVAPAVVEVYKFDPMAKEVPWQGGPLFVPGLRWDKPNARALAGNLIRWHLWCDLQGNKGGEQNQIHNNIRSLSLANAAGYRSPGFRNVGTMQWLQVWGKAVGKEKLKALLEEQKAADNPKYAAALK